MSLRLRRRAAHEAESTRTGRGGLTAAGRGRHAEPRVHGVVRLARRLVLPVVLVGLTVGVMVLGVFPTRTWLDQRRAVSAAETKVAELESANAAKQQQVDALQTDAEVERLARQEYGYAKVGEEVYHVLPPPQDPVKVPDAWPFTRLAP